VGSRRRSGARRTARPQPDTDRAGRSVAIRAVPATGIATGAARLEVRRGEHEQPGLRIDVAVFAVVHGSIVRGSHRGVERIIAGIHDPSVSRAARARSGSLNFVRMLLAALRCEKGAMSENLARHRRVLCEARDAGCAVAVFPEMSLTGSLDPARTPELLIALDDAHVGAMAELTAKTGVAAVFGLSERAAGGAAHITQVVADRGRIVAVQRKRHLGEGEERYTAVDEDATFELDGTRGAIAICAESRIDRPFAHAVSTGAKLVLFCAAPGLYGRRIDEAAWKRGWEWWRGEGVGDAQGHARERGLWIALATQAGSAHDEDFPGVAALIDPEGNVRAELPDWREGNLIVDVPV
jgi:predicted amidohydrolase